LIGQHGQGSETNQINFVTRLVATGSRSNVLYICDSRNHRILSWDMESNQARIVAGRTGSAGSDRTRLYNPYGIAYAEKTASLYIADGFNSRIQKFNLSDPESSTTVAGWGQLNNPLGIELDSTGDHLFISDTMNHRILLWLNGQVQGRTIAGTGQAGDQSTQLNSPSQVRFDDKFNLYVVDTNNCRIQRFNLISDGCMPIG
jgi:sugar lactone lactonase YvrE